MCGEQDRDRMRNGRIGETVTVLEVSLQTQRRRLQWFGHVKWREEDYMGVRVVEMDVKGRRGRGRDRSHDGRTD